MIKIRQRLVKAPPPSVNLLKYQPGGLNMRADLNSNKIQIAA